MNTIRHIIRQITPAPVRQKVWAVYRKWRKWNNEIRFQLEWSFGYKRWLSALRMRSMEEKHSSARCFIIGNGPSLARMDLSPLQNEITFGLNRIYLLFPKIGFHTTYYVAVNQLVTEQCAADIERLPMPKFLNWHARDVIHFSPNMMFVRDPYIGEPLGFSKRPASRIWEGATVTYVAMQLAYFMGFQQVILIGVDHSFSTKGDPHKIVTSSGDDPNHFDPNYFGKGFRWQLPDLETSERAYNLAKYHFENDGRQILDATVDGKLAIFCKVEYQSLFSKTLD